jgi:hypothetical protein
MSDETADRAAFDLRYLYLAGGIFDGETPCASCQQGCTAGGQSCANAAGGCGWWGCWQWDALAPGEYVTNFLAAAGSRGQIPMITYYEILQASGAGEGAPEVQAVNNVAFMRRYFNDWRFVLGRVGSEVAFLHIEPDFWGFAQQVNEDPDAIPAAVATANPTDCGGEENSIAGLGRCMIAMVRKYAPNARVGLHGSGWATRFDVLLNRDPGFDVPLHGGRLGAFLAECGAGLGDYVVVDAADRDAGYYQSIGQNRWWDATNATLPNFQQAFTWANALAERVGRPIVWWQLPLGHMALPNTANRWKDNRVDYFLTHVDEVAAAHGAGMAFGAGAGDQTTPETDDGNFVSRVLGYLQGGAGGACP